MIQIEDLWIDYEVQRDVLHKHIINIMKKWDPRICSPGSACRFGGKPPIYLYDAQHRTIAAGILGFTEIPCAVVETTVRHSYSHSKQISILHPETKLKKKP